MGCNIYCDSPLFIIHYQLFIDLEVRVDLLPVFDCGKHAHADHLIAESAEVTVALFEVGHFLGCASDDLGVDTVVGQA